MEHTKKQKNLIAILLLLFLVIVLSFVMVRFKGISRNVTQEEIETLLAENEDNPESVKYLVTDNCISRIYPETNVETFVTNFSEGEVVKVYSDKACTHQVTDGFVMSGMYAKYDENDRVFEISVLGDINEKDSKTDSDDILFGDGVLNQIELTRNIREAVKDEDWKITEEVEKKSADVNCNNLIDEESVKTIINYIVFGNLKIDEIDLVKKPKIEVIQGDVNTNTVYTSDVVLHVTENEEESLKTVYKITGDKKTGYKEILNNGEIVLKDDGLYKVTVYTYGKLENKSKAEYIIININKTAKYTMEYYLEGVDGNYTKVESDTKIAEGIIGDSVEIESKLYTDYELDVDNELGNLRGNITEDGKLVLKAYYSRKKYTYTFTADDNIESVIVEQGRTEQGRTEQGRTEQESTEQGSAEQSNNEQSNTEQDNSKQESTKQSQIGKTVKVTQKWGEKITINAKLKTQTGYEIIWDCWQNVNNENDKISDITKEIEIAKENREYKATAQKKIIDYTIKYELSGGKLVEGETNPVKYNIETEEFTLKNPSKPGYVFTGWTGTQLEDKSSIVTVNSGSTGNREYTANYQPISNTPYKVEHYKETLETGKYKLAETENLGGETDSTVKAVEKMYNGFTYDANNENTISEGKITADGNLVLKLYYKRNIYNLTITAGENISEVSSEGIITKTTLTTPYKYEQEIEINATLENKIGYTYTWTKWVSSNPKAISDITEKNKLLKMPAQDITLTATAQRVINTYEYKIEYYYDDALEPTKTQTKSGKYGDVISTFSDENIMGYELEKQENMPLMITENEDNNIIKIYYKQKEYFIKYDLKDGKIEDGEIEGGKTNPEKYTIKSENITLNSPIKIGYNFTGWTGGIVDSEGNIINNPTQSETGKTGNVTTETLDVTIEQGSIGNRKYTANWKAKNDTKYKIEHYIENVNSTEKNDSEVNETNYTLYKTEGKNGELVGTTNTIVTATPITITGFTYNERKSAQTISGTILPDGTLVLKIFYTRNSYKLNLVVGENIKSVVNNGESSTTSIEKTYKYEQNVSIGAVLAKITGYTTNWKNWESSNTKLLQNQTKQSEIIKMPAGDVTLTANATKEKANFAYSVEYYYDGIQDENAKVTGETAEFESQITNYTEKLKDGYELDKVENLPLTISATPENNVIKVYYKLQKYSITYDLNDGKLEEGKTNPEIYNIKTEDIVLKNPTKPGNIFVGWTGGVVDNEGNIIQNPTESQTGKTGNTTTETKKLTIQKGSLGNRKYTANWQELSYEVIVHHYLQGTGPKYNNEPVILAEDEIFTSKVLGENYTTDDLIPTYDENGNIIETDGRNYLDGTELYLVENSENTTGTFTSEPIEVTYYYQYYPVVKIVSSPAEELNGTEYITIKEAIQALQNKGLTSESEISKLQILRNVKNENVVIENKNVQIDLSNFTINSKSETEPTIKLDNSKLNIIDESESEQGKIVSENTSGIYIKTNSEFTLGLEEKPVKPTPEIIAKTKGVEKEIVDNKQGIFNFFDGKITAANAIDGIVDLTPILYSATVTTNEQGQQLSVLQIVSNVEARIGRKTYLKLEDAIADVGTEYGTDGSQVEVTVVKDLTKDKEVVIDSSKNVLLDLNGCVVTTTGSNYVFNNNGKLEIIDRTSQDIIKIDSLTPNGTYYFEKNEDGSFTSNNKGASGVANSYATIDLTEYEGTYILSLQAEICGYSNYGYATITQTTNAPAYNATSGRLVYMTNIVGREYFEEELQGGSVYYLHLGYKKDDDSKLFDDEFKVNDIKVIKKTTGKVSPGTAGSIKNSSTGEFVLTSGNLTPSSLGAVENYGTCRINGGRIVGNNYGVMNKDSGNLIVNGGLIKTSRGNAISACGKNTAIEGGIIQSDNTTISISNNGSAENLVINNGTISSTNGTCINNYSTNPVIINNGYICGSDTCIYSVSRKFGN